jgi:hypothetical protein
MRQRRLAPAFVGNLQDRLLAHPVNEKIRFGIGQKGAAELLLFVIVMDEAAQGGFDAAENDGDAGIG